ncbi:ABC-type multidrug transport system, permease component [Thermomonospora echinospora]|uniref:Transport permease protein n=2 Tax=Thermomonospora echinospora TaxID=1992 RepID=A0A1H5TWR0_9ACTN|nr:ABC-type multidrug transport system, permease component [Thermomonospora echinospora]
MSMPIAPAIPTTPAERLRWALSDAWVVSGRELIHWVRNPVVILNTLLFPLIMVLLFGYVFGSAMRVAGGGDYREFLMPGMFGQTMVFGVISTVYVVAANAARGVTDRFRSMPVSSFGVLMGRVIADMLTSTLDLVILMLCGLLVGWRAHHGLGSALAAAGLLLLLRFALVWVGICMGLRLTPEGAGAAWMPLFPLTLLANTFVSPELMPAWLRIIAEWNPLSATVQACRELFGSPGLSGGSWAAEHAIELAIGWPLLITVIFLPLSIRRYRRLNR